MSLVFFVVIVLAVYVLMHVAVYARVVGGLGLHGVWRQALGVLVALAGLSFVAGEVFRRTAWGGPLLEVGSTWLGVVAIACTVVAVEAVVSRLLPDLRFTAIVVAIGLVAGLSAYAWFNAARPPVLVDLTVSLPTLPRAASGFTIVQVSDLHLHRHSSRERLQGIVDRVNSLSPGLVVITGDLLDDDIPEATGLAKSLRSLAAKHGVVAVPGNHEYYAGYAAFERFARRSNITILRNSRRLVGGVVEIAGIDEPAGRSFAEGGPNLDEALDGRDPALPVILLSHRPESFARYAAQGVNLQLSGHTHAGQIPPLDLLIWLVYPYAYGYHEEGGSAIYTSCGTGTWGPPMRLFSRSEIVRVRLVRPAAE